MAIVTIEIRTFPASDNAASISEVSELRLGSQTERDGELKRLKSDKEGTI